jgi:hypothetical protein
MFVSSAILIAVNLIAVIELYGHIKTFSSHLQIQKFRAIKFLLYHLWDLQYSPTAVCILCSCRRIYADDCER